jgi:hypothetical protein
MEGEFRTRHNARQRLRGVMGERFNRDGKTSILGELDFGPPTQRFASRQRDGSGSYIVLAGSRGDSVCWFSPKQQPLSLRLTWLLDLLRAMIAGGVPNQE